MTGELAAALVNAQKEFQPITKGHTNPHYNSRYADLSDVLKAVLPALQANGILLTQPIENGDLVTRLILGGESLESRVPLNLDRKPQEIGSELTYMRRYSLAALLGVASEDDDDGNAASATQRRRSPGGGAPTREDGVPSGSRSISNTSTRAPSPKILGARMNALGYDKTKKAQFCTAVIGAPRNLDECTSDELIAVSASLDRVADGELPTFTEAGALLPWKHAGEPFDTSPLTDAEKAELPVSKPLFPEDTDA